MVSSWFLARYRHLVEKYSVTCVHVYDGIFWQLHVGSKLTIVSLLYVPMALYTIKYQYDGEVHRSSMHKVQD